MFIDKDGRDICIWYGDKTFNFNGKNAAQAPNDAFVQNVIRAYIYDTKNGGWDNLKIAATNPNLKISMVESILGENSYDPNQNAVFWDPNLAFEKDGLHYSPATGLEHEFDHAVDYQLNPKEHSNRVGQKVPQYENAEEERVMNGSEYKTALANGEIKKGQKRKDHGGGNSYYVPRPETNKSLDYQEGKNQSVQEFLKSIIDQNPDVKVYFK